MDSKGTGDLLFRFRSPRHERINERLLRLVGPGPAAFYRDACRVMDNEALLETSTHQVAHCLREIESALRDVLESFAARSDRVGKKGQSGDERHRAEIMAILTGLSIGETEPVAIAWLKLPGAKNEYGLHARAHRDSLAPPRPLDDEFRSFWTEIEGILDAVLDKLESRYLEYHRLLDSLLAKPRPTAADIDVLRNHVPNNLVAHFYFFQRLSSPAWLEPLAGADFFKHPPEPIREETGTSFSTWPQSQYLARAAASAPETVARIALEIPATENIRVHADLAQAAVVMPPKLAAQMVPTAITWIRSPFQLLLVPQRLGVLLSHLAKGGQVDSAMTLAKALLAVRADPRVTQEAIEENPLLFPEAQPYFDLWNYEQIVSKNVPDLVKAAGEPALALLCDLLEDAVRLSRRADEVEELDDYSHIWRPALDRGQSTDRDVRGLLISAVREAAEKLCEQDRSRVNHVVRDVERRGWRVFHRLALHVLRLFADGAPDLVAKRLSDPGRFDLPDFRREYDLLAEERFRFLSPEDKGKIFAWIEKGLDVKFVKGRLAEFAGRPVTDEEVDPYLKQWQRDRLSPLAAYLPEAWKRRYAELVEVVGPGEDPGCVRSVTGGAFGPKSPLDTGELHQMTVEQLVDYLSSWVPSGKPIGESTEGLGGELGALVTAEPERYSAESERFKGLDPTYIRGFLQALWAPVKEKRAVAWGSVLNLCRWVMDQPREIPGRKGGLLDRDPDWGWARNAIAKLLSEGFDHDSIPFESRVQAWNVLERLTKDSMPTPEDDARHGENMDPATYSINTTRGEAMHAVVRYALWVRRRLEEGPNGKGRVARGFDEMPEVRSALEKHLDPSQDPSIAIRVVYGQRFPTLFFLDPIWAKANATKVFPGTDNSKELHDVAWGSYVLFCQPHNEVFDALIEQYREAIEAIGGESHNWHHLGSPDSRLAEHLMMEYSRGHIDWERPAGLMLRFYAKADPKLRGWALEFVGRSLREHAREILPEALERLKSLWAKRLEIIRSSGKASAESEELRSFAWWFVCKRFDDDWAMNQLREALQIAGKTRFDFLIAERLAELSPEMPARTVECLSMMVEGDRDGLDILGWQEHARTILSTAVESDDLQARTLAVELIHRLGARGHPEFADLLPTKVE